MNWTAKEYGDLSELMNCRGWQIFEQLMKEGVEMEVTNLMRQTEVINVGKCVGRIEAMRRILLLPKMAVENIRSSLELPEIES